MKLAFRIASRFLLASRGQTILIVVGIVIGVSVQVFIGSLIDGLQRSLVDTTIGSSAQVTIAGEDRNTYFDPPAGLFERLANDAEVTAASKVLDASGFLAVADDAYPVRVRGFIFDQAESIYKISGQLVQGSMPQGMNQALIGRNLADEAGLAPGDTVVVLTPSGQENELIISGIFDLKVAVLNETWLLTDLVTAQDIFAAGTGISAIELQVASVFEADAFAASLQESLPGSLRISNWKAENEQLLSGLAGQSASSYMIQVFVLLAVLLGISSVLAISVVQKSRQIGILKAMGIKNKTASQIFLLQGFLLGLIGAALGAGLGLGLSFAFSVFVQNPDGTPLVPFYFDPVFVAFSFVIAVIAATVSALIPARKSSRLNPIEVIKNG